MVILPNSINCRGRLLSLASPQVMAILNVSPESFYDGSKATRSDSQLVDYAELQLAAGAAIIDVGGASSRPGAADIDEQLEIDRVVPALEVLAKAYPNEVLSVDTWRASVAKVALQAGASMVNDISGGRADPDMWSAVAEARVPFVAMHRLGPSATMQIEPEYPDGVVETIYRFFSETIAKARDNQLDDLIIDPGFGFGKTVEQNFELLARLADFRFLRRPILVGISRKSMLNKTLGISPARALNATSIAHTLALQRGADILRVHDVGPAIEAIKIHLACQAQDPYRLPPVPLG